MIHNYRENMNYNTTADGARHLSVSMATAVSCSQWRVPSASHCLLVYLAPLSLMRSALYGWWIFLVQVAALYYWCPCLSQSFTCPSALFLSQVLDSFRPSGSRPRGASRPQQQPERETRVQHRHQRGHPALMPCRPSPVDSFIITPPPFSAVGSGQVRSERDKVPALQSTAVLYECLLFGRWHLTSSVTFSSSRHRRCM